MDTVCSYEQCTGCMACLNACPCDAIDVVQDAKGFLVPQINVERCVNCSKCKRICPQNSNTVLHTTRNVYAMLAKDDMLRDKSSSGGVFTLLAKETMRKDGVVFGAAFDLKWHVHHTSACNEQELEALRISKYVQSDIGLIYRDVKSVLESGRQALFVGTPCQVDGLKAYLNKEYAKLLTVDLVCHGVPSPGVFSDWVADETQKHGALKAISFRVKDPGWKWFRARMWFENGETVDCKQSEGYVGGFLENLYLRECCYACPYACTSRTGDISLGDYWRYTETKPERIEDDDRGISLVMVNTEKGEKAIRRIRAGVALAPRTMEDALRGNPVLQNPAKRSDRYDAFWQDYKTMPFDELMHTYVPKKPEEKDPIHPDDRRYFKIPYVKRHPKHVLHCIKVAVINRLKKR